MRRYTIKVNDSTEVIDVQATGANQFRVQIDGRWIDVELEDHRDLGHGTVTPVLQTRAAQAAPTSAPVAARPSAPAGGAASAAAPAKASAPAGGGAASADKLTAPMPGVILDIKVAVGDAVKRGDALMVLEAMKMKNELCAQRDGVVAEIYPSVGQQVKYGEFLARIEER